MSSLANALVSQVLGHSDAEKAFRPWWDNFEDYLVYALVMLGKNVSFYCLLLVILYLFSFSFSNTTFYLILICIVGTIYEGLQS